METHDPTSSNANDLANPYPYDTARVSELLKRKRRVRGIKSCFPCRHRKVRCDGSLPCVSCVKRGHPELCQLAGRGNDVGGGVSPVGEGMRYVLDIDPDRRTRRILPQRYWIFLDSNMHLATNMSLVLAHTPGMPRQLLRTAHPAPTQSTL